MRVLKTYKPDDAVIKEFCIRYQTLWGHSIKDEMMELVIWDSRDLAGDNGEYLYR
jgi:hypothetical protein